MAAKLMMLLLQVAAMADAMAMSAFRMRAASSQSLTCMAFPSSIVIARACALGAPDCCQNPLRANVRCCTSHHVRTRARERPGVEVPVCRLGLGGSYARGSCVRILHRPGREGGGAPRREGGRIIHLIFILFSDGNRNKTSDPTYLAT